MAAPEPPRRNRHGREIWFVYRDGGHDIGGYAPANRKGCLAFVFGVLWVLFSAAVGFAVFAAWQSPIALGVMFAVGIPGLLAMGITVYRHS